MKRTGVDVHRFDVLPMLGVRGTKSQVERLLGLSAPISIYVDRELDFLLHESVRTIGVERVRSGLGYDGTGVGVAVIDSGVDGTNRDVRYPGRLVQNVKIAGDAFFTGSTVVLEDQKNTDTTSGHGTHVAGTVGGSGANSGGYYTGVAPGSDLGGIGTGDTFAAGNEGPGRNTLNPYSVAPWVIGVAAGRKDGKMLASFTSRDVQGDNLYHPDIAGCKHRL